MDFLGFIWDVFLWVLLTGCALIAFGVGKVASDVVYTLAQGISDILPFHLPRFIVDLFMRGNVLFLGIVLCFIGKVPILDVFNSFVSFGNFDELTLEMTANQNPFILNTVMDTIWHELLMTFIFFQPYFLVTEVIGLTKAALCERNEESWYGVVAFFFELTTLFATNVAILYFDKRLAMFAYETILTMKWRYGVLRMLIMLIVFCIYFARIVCDMFGSDLFLSMFAANVVAMILGINLTGGTHTLVFILSIVMGYVSKLGRTFTVYVIAGEEGGMSDWYSLGYGVISGLIMGILFLIIMKLFGM